MRSSPLEKCDKISARAGCLGSYRLAAGVLQYRIVCQPSLTGSVALLFLFTDMPLSVVELAVAQNKGKRQEAVTDISSAGPRFTALLNCEIRW